MANRSLFQSFVGTYLPATTTINEAGGVAYSLSPQQALASYAATGCLNGTYYASATDQLAQLLDWCQQVPPSYLAQLAIYSRKQALMKDFPVLMCAVLSVRQPDLLPAVFERVIDSPRTLRSFVQIMRSGAVGRKSLGTMPKRLILNWLASRTDKQLFTASVGNAPSLADIIKMVHPKPATASRETLYAYLIGREHDAGKLPDVVKQFEKYKGNPAGKKVTVPDVPFQMLTGLPLPDKAWKRIARNASWQTTRMNLNTFLRHRVFEDPSMVQCIAERLRDRQQVRAAKAFPYQLLMAHRAASAELPQPIREALGTAMEIAIENVPAMDGRVIVCPDVSGSMHSAITGTRAGATSRVRCIDVAALVAAAVLRKNPTARVLPFESEVVPCELNPNNTVVANAEILCRLPAGGTNCSAPLRWLNERHVEGDWVVYISDNESWLDSPMYGLHGGVGATETLKQWNRFKARNRKARLVCIDIQPYPTAQVVPRPDILQVAGFSDDVFRLLASSTESCDTQDYWLTQIQQISLES